MPLHISVNVCHKNIKYSVRTPQHTTKRPRSLHSHLESGECQIRANHFANFSKEQRWTSLKKATNVLRLLRTTPQPYLPKFVDLVEVRAAANPLSTTIKHFPPVSRGCSTHMHNSWHGAATDAGIIRDTGRPTCWRSNSSGRGRYRTFTVRIVSVNRRRTSSGGGEGPQNYTARLSAANWHLLDGSLIHPRAEPGRVAGRAARWRHARPSAGPASGRRINSFLTIILYV